MATAPRLGLNPCKTVGSGPNNGGLTEYAIASGYGTALGVGDLVKLTTDGSVIQGTNAVNQLGVFAGCTYADSTGRLQIQKYWPASQTSTNPAPTCLVMDYPEATFNAVCAGTIDTALTIPGALYALNLTAPNSSTGRSTMTVQNIASTTGSLAITGTNNAGLTNLENGDAFAINTSVNTSPVTVTIVTNQTPAQLLALINAIPGVVASLNASTHYLTIAATDGGNLVLTDGSGTPLADSNTFTGQTTTATLASTVADSSAAVEIMKVIDVANKVVEVRLVNQLFRAQA